MGAYWSTLAATFLAVFLAELGDKTQLAALGLSSASKHPWAVFLGSSIALVASSALAVGLGRVLATRLDLRWLHYGGAALFLSIGLFMLIRGPAR